MSQTIRSTKKQDSLHTPLLNNTRETIRKRALLCFRKGFEHKTRKR